MGILNRRNALLGWATWQATKRIAAQRARSAADVESGRPTKGLILGGLAAVGAVVFFWRRKGDESPPESPE